MQHLAGIRLRQALEQMEIVRLSSGSYYLTPPDVRITRGLRQTPHWRFILRDARTGSELLATYNRSIFRGGATFPPICCACMQPADHFELAEVSFPAAGSRQHFGWLPRSLLRHTSVQRKTRRLLSAMFERRFWYPVPFCSRHDLDSRAVHISARTLRPQDWRLQIDLANQAYGKEFAQVNQAPGIWLGRTALWGRWILPGAGCIGLVGLVLLRSGPAGHWVTGLVLLLLALGALAWIFLLWWREYKGRA